MSNTPYIVKRKGHSEPYDERKLYASIYSALLSVRTPSGEAELVAGQVCEDLVNWLAGKHEITSYDIRLQATGHLQAYNHDAAYIYRHHRDIS